MQHYAWGDTTFLPELMGEQPDGRPWAEWWVGTHPNGPCRLEDGSLLSDVTGEMPYLLKVLAVGQPLSLQAHPTAIQAADGFQRGIYTDTCAKPELLRALTEFQALCGLRTIESTVSLFDELGLDESEIARIVASDGTGAALRALLLGRIDPLPIIDRCQTSDRIEAAWVRALAIQYPGDPSVASTLLLNHITLEPGEALRLDAGNLHAYLLGAGVELMGASDNVVRAGLTEKQVDIAELLNTVDLTPLIEPVLAASDRHELPAIGVALAKLESGQHHVALDHELAIDLNGLAWYFAPGEAIQTSAVTFVVVPV